MERLIVAMFVAHAILIVYWMLYTDNNQQCVLRQTLSDLCIPSLPQERNYGPLHGMMASRGLSLAWRGEHKRGYWESPGIACNM